MDYKETKTKITKFLSGKGFYFVLAGCLVATGIAAWTAYAGLSEQTQKTPNNNSGYVAESEDTPSTEEVQTETESEPYSSEETESEEEFLENVVATNFVYPFSSNVVKKFSDSELTYSATFGDLRLHTGLDLAAEVGQTVGACGNGIVTAINHDKLLGTYVEIDHGNGVIARYCGLNESVLVEMDEVVSAGVALGYVASVPFECEDETHLHLEFFKNKTPVDPQKIIG